MSVFGKAFTGLILIASTIVATDRALGQGKATLVRETAEYMIRKFGTEASDEGIETLTRKVEVLVAKYGDDSATALRNVGPRSFRLIQEAGENGTLSVKMLAKYGDQAVWVVSKPSRMSMIARYGDEAADAMIKHGEMAEPLINQFGASATRALGDVTSRNARRIAILSESGELAAMGRTRELLDVIGRYGDSAMEFVWRNKGALAVAGAMAAFLADPKPFIDGTRDLAEIVGSAAVAPLATAIGNKTNWTFLFSLLILLVTGWIVCMRGLRRPAPQSGQSIGR